MPPAHDIHETAHVGPDVKLGSDVVIGPGAVLLGPLHVGDRVWIGPNVVIGGPPEISSLRQNAAWTGDIDHAGVVIGDDVVIRELSAIHQGSHRATTIGAGTWVLNSTYVAHDCIVGENVTLSAGVRLGGHCVVGDFANLGMGAIVHQRRVVGPGTMIGMGTPVAADVPPFGKAYGSPARVHGVNSHVLRKLGVDETADALLLRAFESSPDRWREFHGSQILGDLVDRWLAHDPTRIMAAESAA